MSETLTQRIKKKNYSFWEKLKRFAKYIYFRILRIQATPEVIARGLAAGVFIGLLPVLPVQTILSIILAFIVRGSKIAAMLGTWVSNPLNWVPLYILFYKIGYALMPFDVPKLNLKHVQFTELLHVGWELLVAMMVGGLIVAIPCTFISYFISLKAIRLYQERKKKKIKEKEIAKFKAIREECNKLPKEDSSE